MPKTSVAQFPAVEAEWWRAKELDKAPHEILDTLVHQLEDDQESRYAAYREYAKLFGADPDMFGYDDAFAALRAEQVSQNELANTIETIHAQVFKNKIVPAVSTSEADWEEWQRGKAYSRWLEGCFAKGNVHEDAVPRAGLDMFVYGTGFIKIGHEIGEEGEVVLTFTRVDPRMILTDRLEARNGKPRSLFMKTFEDRFKVLADYGTGKGLYGDDEERQEGIRKAGNANSDVDLAIGSHIKCEMLALREAWHLPSKRGAKDGRHVIWVKGVTLVDEPWDWSRFPLTVMRFGHRLSGFYGDSAVKRLAPTQKQFDKLNKKIDEAQDLMGVARIIMSRNANIRREYIDDIPGGILECDGNIDGAIKEWNATAVAPELYQERDAAPQKMRSLLGISDFDVQSQLPQSMREVSGPALERWIDAGTARHAMTHAELENAMVDLAYLAMDYAADLQKEGKDLTVVAPGTSKSSIELLKFSEVKVDKARMRLRVQPMSQMPQTISGKIDAFQKLRDSGDMDKQTFMRMLEVPDSGGVTDFLGSDEEIILKNLHFMVKKGVYTPPLQYDNLDLIPPLATAFINHYRLREDCDMTKVGMLAQYIEDALSLKEGLDGGTDPNAPPPVDPTMATGGMPMDPSMAGGPGAPPPMAGPGLPPPGMAPPGPVGPPPNGPPMGPPMPMGPPGPGQPM